MNKLEYKIGHGFHISQKDAPILGTAWEALEKRLKRPPTRNDLVAAAADPKSPFHRFFQWDDQRAAVEYRLTQAGYIIQALDVTLPEYGFTGRAIIPVNAQGDDHGGFMSTAKAIRERPDLIRNWYKRLHAEAQRIVEQYGAVEALMQSAGHKAQTFIKAARDLAQEPV